MFAAEFVVVVVWVAVVVVEPGGPVEVEPEAAEPFVAAAAVVPRSAVQL